MDTQALLAKYDRPAPRYTSFPTAVHFDQDISQQYYASLLANLNDTKPISIYIHIPFCHILCHYCGCNTKVANSYAPVKAYVQTLLKEIRSAGDKLTKCPPISQIHFGGGSPNFLEIDDFKAILDELAIHFDIDDSTAIAIETDPRILTDEKVAALVAAGVTRASLGVQDFNADVQRAVNRVQSFESVRDNVLAFREAGVQSINFDLMIGLPLQTLGSVEETLEQAISLRPDRFAIFAYAHVPWLKKHQKLLERYEMPKGELRFEMSQLVQEKLEEAGYHAIGIDHFAHESDSLYLAQQEGRLRRNFQGYTDDQADTILGFGLSSISCFGGAYVQNTTDAPKYRKAVEAGKFPITRGRVLSDDDKQRRALIEHLMCNFCIDVGQCSKWVYNDSLLKELKHDGIISCTSGGLKVTELGRPFVRIVASCFDPYFEIKEKQHARAI